MTSRHPPTPPTGYRPAETDPTRGRSAGTPLNAQLDPTSGRAAGTPLNADLDPTRGRRELLAEEPDIGSA